LLEKTYAAGTAIQEYAQTEIGITDDVFLDEQRQEARGQRKKSCQKLEAFLW